MSTHTWSVVTHVARHHILPCCGQLWHQEDQYGWQAAACYIPQRTLLHLSRLDRFPLLLSQTNVGLHRLNGQSPHVKLHQQGTPQVPTPNFVKATACSTQSCPDAIRSMCASSYDRHFSPTLQWTNQAPARHCWHTSLLPTSNRPHDSPSHQRNHLTAITGHGSHGWCMSSTSRLHRDTSQCRHMLPCKQHDPCYPHRCIVSFRTQCTQSGISTLLPHQQRWQKFQQQCHSNLASIIKHDMSSALEAELAALYYVNV